MLNKKLRGRIHVSTGNPELDRAFGQVVDDLVDLKIKVDEPKSVEKSKNTDAVKGVEINDTNKGSGKSLVYNSKTNKLDYSTISGGGGGGSGDITAVRLTSDSGNAYDGTEEASLTISGGNVIGTTAGGSALTINHNAIANTDINNSGTTFVQDIIFDDYGHVTGATSVDSTEISNDNNTPSSALSGNIKIHIKEDTGTIYFMGPSKIWWLDTNYSISLLFSISSFVDDQASYELMGLSSATWRAIGAIEFNATYANPPAGMTASIAQSGSSAAWSSALVIDEADEATTEITKYPSSVGNTITFTLTAKDSGDSTIGTATTTVQFKNAVRYGSTIHDIGNQTTAMIEAFDEVSDGSSMESTTSQTISNMANTAIYVAFAYPDRISKPNQVQIRSAYGGSNGYVTASFNSTATTLAPEEQTSISLVENSAGFEEDFACVTSRLQGLADGSNDFKLTSSSTAMNYIYWGISSTGSSFSESDVEGMDRTSSSDDGIDVTNTETFTWSVTATSGKYIVFAYPTRLTTSGFYFDGSAQEGGMQSPETVALTNDGGFTEDYYVYASENHSLGATSIETKET